MSQDVHIEPHRKPRRAHLQGLLLAAVCTVGGVLTACSSEPQTPPETEDAAAASIPAKGSIAPSNAVEVSATNPLTSGISEATAPLLEGIGPGKCLERSRAHPCSAP